MEPVVQLEDVVALLNGFPALTGLTMRVEAGELVQLRGPNGAGKTTVLRVCAGLEEVAAGRAEVLGVDLVSDAFAVRGRVGLLGHDSGLYDDLTVAENLDFWSRSNRSRPEDLAAATKTLGLDGRLAGVVAGGLSAGQRRRCALALLIARRAQLWLLDEPHAGLDAETRDLLDSVLRDAIEAGVSIVLSSHDERAARVVDRVIDIKGGRCVDDGRLVEKQVRSQ